MNWMQNLVGVAINKKEVPLKNILDLVCIRKKMQDAKREVF